jgi:hypothetical protein
MRTIAKRFTFVTLFAIVLLLAPHAFAEARSYVYDSIDFDFEINRDSTEGQLR